MQSTSTALVEHDDDLRMNEYFNSSDHIQDIHRKTYHMGVIIPLLFAPVAVFFGILYSSSISSSKYDWINLMLLCAVLVVGMSGLLYILYNIKKYRSKYIRPKRSVTLWKIRLFFVTFFLVGITSVGVTLLIIEIKCVQQDNSGIEIVLVFYRILHLLYITMQVVTLFICILGNSKFAGSRYTWISVLAIIFTNLTYWEVVTVESASGGYESWLKNRSFSNASEDMSHTICFYNSTIYKKYYLWLLPYTSPMHLEFYILVSSSFLLLVSNYNCNNGRHGNYISLDNHASNIQLSNKYPATRKAPISLKLCSLLNLILNVVASLGSYFLHRDYVSHSKLNFFQNVIEMLLNLVCVIAWIFLFIGFRIMQKAMEIQHSPVVCKRNNILILCMSATVMFATMDIFDVIFTSHRRYLYNIINVIAKNVVFMLEAFYQTLFIHKAKSFEIHVDGMEYKRNIFRYACLNISLFNLIVWLTDTFAVSVRDSVIPGSIFWIMVKHVVYPFEKYFRFQSSFDMFTLYQNAQN